MRTTTYTDWLWTPMLGERSAWWAGLVLTVVLAVVVLALWPVRIPGGASKGERALQRIARYVRRVPVIGSGLLLLIVGLSPAAIVAGIALMFFQCGKPRVLLLSTRARLADAGAWDAEWSETVARDLPSPQAGEEYVDAGPVVERICRLLVAQKPPGGRWRRDDSAHREAIHRIVKEALLDNNLRAELVPAPASLKPAPPITDLEPWLVGSVEMTVLRAEAQRSNVRKLVALVTSRQSPGGSRWAEAADYCQTGWLQPEAIDVKIRPQRVPLVLREVLIEPGTGTAGELAIKALIQRPGREAGTPDTRSLTLVLEGTEPGATVQTRLQSRTVWLTLAAEPGIEPVLVRFPLAAGQVPMRVGTYEPFPTFPRGGRISGLPGAVRVRVRAGPAAPRWERSLAALRDAPSFEPWRRRMADDFRLPVGPPGIELSFDTAPFTPATGSASPAAEDVSLRVDGPSVWVYSAEFAGPLPATVMSPAPAGATESTIIRARSTAAGEPGLYSWNELPLLPNPITRLDHPMAVPLAERYAQPAEFGWRANKTLPVPVPVMTRLVVRTPTGKPRLLTHIGIDPLAQGVLLTDAGAPDAGYERARFLSFWTAVFESAHAAASDTAADPQEAFRQSEDDEPAPLLEAADLTGLTARSLYPGLASVLLGTFLYALLLCLGVMLAPKTGDLR